MVKKYFRGAFTYLIQKQINLPDLSWLINYPANIY